MRAAQGYLGWDLSGKSRWDLQWGLEGKGPRELGGGGRVSMKFWEFISEATAVHSRQHRTDLCVWLRVTEFKKAFPAANPQIASGC